MFMGTSAVLSKALFGMTTAFAVAAMLQAASASAGDTVYYYSSDTVHSEVVVTDQNRNVVERTYYAPYGQVLNRDLRDGPGYTGHEEDPETGLVYMQQRYYCPECGRFLSVDPVGVDPTSGGNFNRYEYAQDNPYRYTDPDGRESGDLSLRSAEYMQGNLQAFDSMESNFTPESAKTAVAVGVIIAAVGGAGEVVGLVKAAATVDKALSDARVTPTAQAAGNSNPYKGPVSEPVTAVDNDGNAIPVNKGEQIASSPSGRYQQVKDSTGAPTGTRLDKGGHAGHADPQAQAPHAHRPGVTDENGNPHCLSNPRS